MFKSCWLINIFNLKKRRDYSQIVFLEVVIQIFWGIKWKAMWKTRSMFNKTVNFSRCHSFHFPIKESKNKNKQKRKRRFKKIIGALTIFHDSPPLLHFGILLEYPLPSPLLRADVLFEWPLTGFKHFVDINCRLIQLPWNFVTFPKICLGIFFKNTERKCADVISWDRCILEIFDIWSNWLDLLCFQ